MDYRQQYEFWLQNVRPHERAELEALAGDDRELRERFTLPLAFGTAGMRGTICLGISDMNTYTVARATSGLAAYIDDLGGQAKARGVVVSYDTRRKSFDFALTTARVLGAAGIRVFLFENVRPVPMCSYAVRHLQAVAGVMITASHNPKEYNGYKVYGEDGAQMSPEATARVVGYIEKAPYFGIPEEPVEVSSQADVAGRDGARIGAHIEVIGKRLDEDYFAEIAKLSLSPRAVARVGKKIKIVYSPIHGSGYMPVTTMLGRMGISVNVVEEQKDPDTEFSTVAMPNPEQPDALAMGIRLAERIGADIVIGTDPDCDRMGVALRAEDGYRLLTGNQIGALLMDYILRRHSEEGTLPPNAAVVKTIVTTKLADRIARSYGAAVFDVLTGFKFIGEKIKEWESSGEYTFLFGYEESYGYLSGTHARDKDAVVAAMLFAEMFCYYSDSGVGMYERLTQLYERYGFFKESSTSVQFKGLDGMEKMAAIMEKFRAADDGTVGGTAYRSKTDLKSSTVVYADGTKARAALPSADVVRYDLGGDEWICVRPSGTEPKLKVYVSTNASTARAAEEKNERLRAALLRAVE